MCIRDRIIGCLVCVGMDYETYNKGAGFLGWLLTPATVCLAIPLYRQLNLLRQHGAAVLISILAVSYTHLYTGYMSGGGARNEMAMETTAAAMDMGVMPGEISVEAQVSVTFNLQ